MNSEEVIAPYLVKVHPEHKAAVRTVLNELLFYIIGHLSVNHMAAFPQALIRNQFVDIILAACKEESTVFQVGYLPLYGQFLVEKCPLKMLNPKEELIS